MRPSRFRVRQKVVPMGGAGLFVGRDQRHHSVVDLHVTTHDGDRRSHEQTSTRFSSDVVRRRRVTFIEKFWEVMGEIPAETRRRWGRGLRASHDRGRRGTLTPGPSPGGRGVTARARPAENGCVPGREQADTGFRSSGAVARSAPRPEARRPAPDHVVVRGSEERRPLRSPVARLGRRSRR